MIKVFNRDMELLAYLEQAFNVGYEMPMNSLWTANFSLPANDEKNDECQPFNFVELYDETEYIGLFRILPRSTSRSSDGTKVTYQCEHVLATLLDDILFQYHTVGGTDISTGDVISYLLDKQTTKRWKLGTCEFEHEFEYTWENDNLLGALFSVPKPFIDEYILSWDTTSYPWSLNLIRPSVGVEAYIRYGINLQGIERHEDPSNLGTRLYCLGYGEGVNQLTISEVNGGKPYLDSDTQSQFGIIQQTFVDRSIENAETLKARGQALLEQIKTPRLTYRVDAAELYAITKDPIDKFRTGAQVRVIDEELGIDFVSRVVKYTKGDVWGNPGAVNLEIANVTQNIATSTAALDRRLRINETHAQGATNINVYNLAENCDPTHPAKFRVWIPNEAVRINKVLLTYSNERFRANSKAIEAAPSTTSGPSSTETTEAGGGETSSPGYWTLVPPQPLIGDFMLPAGEDNHVHEMYSVSHVHTTDVHVHKMDHTHVIPAHDHEIRFGIFEGPSATAIGLLVDGNNVGGARVSETHLDLVDYLELDDEGKIKRGQWHTIEIIPNTLSRIVANVVIQFFVNSRGGGDY